MMMMMVTKWNEDHETQRMLALVRISITTESKSARTYEQCVYMYCMILYVGFLIDERWKSDNTGGERSERGYWQMRVSIFVYMFKIIEHNKL